MLNFGDDALRRSVATAAALACVLGALHAFGAEKARIKWVTSVYADAGGDGLRNPEGVTCDDDSIVVADTGNARIVRYSYQGPAVTAKQEVGLPRTHPSTIQQNSKGDVYFLDARDRRIALLPAGGDKRVFLDPKGAPTRAEIVPKSFRIDGNDNIYLLDIFSNRLLVLDSEGQYSSHIRLPEKHGFFSDLAVDRQGNVYVLDSVEAVVYFAAKGAKEFSSLTESLKDYLDFPTNLTVDSRGVVYLVDRNGSGLGLVGPDGAFIGRKLGLGWKESGLHYPAQICISESGNIFIADRNNSRVQMFSVQVD